MHQGLIRASLDDRDIVELETDIVGAYWEWTDSMTNGVYLEHDLITRQLNTRKLDENLSLVSRPIHKAFSAMARYISRRVVSSFMNFRELERWCAKYRTCGGGGCPDKQYGGG